VLEGVVILLVASCYRKLDLHCKDAWCGPLKAGHLIGCGKKKLCRNFQVYYVGKYFDYAENTLDYAEI